MSEEIKSMDEISDVIDSSFETFKDADMEVWDKCKEYKEAGTVIPVTVEGIANKGVIASVEGLRGFIPASQVSNKYVEDLNDYLNKEIEVVVIEVDEQQKRLILSAKKVLQAKAEEAKSEDAAEEPAIKSWVENTAWSLLPPIIAIALALITKEVYSSLFIGILLGAMMHVNYAAIPTIDALVKEGLVPAVSDTAGIFLFLCILGIMVALINKTGAASAFGTWAKGHIKSRAGAVIATFILGVLIFIDDYFNCLTVGSVMLPVTDSKKISRAKLAYIIDATAAPICMIAPVSSWAAAVADFADGTGYSGIHLFIKAIPYNFYSLLTFIFIIGITLMKVDYGPMAKQEKNAMEKGDLITFGEVVTVGV